MTKESHATPGEDVKYQIQDDERCPQCRRDFATCRCYDQTIKEAEVNAYAAAMTSADREARHTGEARHDLDTCGRPMREGT